MLLAGDPSGAAVASTERGDPGAFVMGERAPRWIDTVDGYEAMLVRADGTACESAGWYRIGRALDAGDGATS